MTKEQIINNLELYTFGRPKKAQVSITVEELQSLIDEIKALEQDNEEIFKQFKKKLFLESEDVLGNEMVDSYMIADYLAELLGVGND